MKTLFPISPKKFAIILVMGGVHMVAEMSAADAQLPPDCTSGTTMYAIFNDSTGSLTNAPSEIRSVNTATGAVGALMGGAFTIKKGSFFGSAALGVDAISNRFYVNTQMSGAAQKDFISWDPVTSTQVVIATTPNIATANVPGLATGLNNYHFVKMAISAGGIGYAIGVSRDTTTTTPATCNPLISFTTCGTLPPTLNCSTIKLLGFLPVAAFMTNWDLFNGDIAFNSAGDLYFATAAYAFVGGAGRYTNARLFKIAAANIPTVPGSGSIPMTLVSDYIYLDSTVVNGIAFDALGKMYMATRRFTGVQGTVPAPKFVNELYYSPTKGNVTQLTGFSVPTAGYSIADLASCYYPVGVLSQKELLLKSIYSAGKVNLKWEVTNNDEVVYFEVQRGDKENNFETIAKIDPNYNGQTSAGYSYSDLQAGAGKSQFYRIREVTTSGIRFYSNVEKVNISSRMEIIAQPRPNPFVDRFVFTARLKSSANIYIRLLDQTGRTAWQQTLQAQAGANQFTIGGLSILKPGIYTAELRVDDEVMREKMIKQ